jgi:integrase/recombinase XerD
MPGEQFQLYDSAGRRLYMTQAERLSVLAAAERAGRDVRTFCHVLTHSGARISEALNLTADRVDLAAGVIVLETLKKRRRGIYRPVPVPASVLDALELVHNIRDAQRAKDKGRSITLWPWGRTTGWRRVQEVIADARIEKGPHASPKGLRHGFGVYAVGKGVPLNMLQKWLGHAQLSTTAIYANAMGEEEQNIAARMW